MTMTEQDNMWTFSAGMHGVLGLGTDTDQQVQACVQEHDEVFGGETIIILAAVHLHAACVLDKGTLWTWVLGANGRLGHGNREPSQRLTRLGKEMYSGSPALMVSCGNDHTLVLTVKGLVWTCRLGEHGQLEHGNTTNKLILTRNKTNHLDINEK